MNAVREGRMIRTWKVFVEETLKAVIDNKHVLLAWLGMHAGTAHQRIHNKKITTTCRHSERKSRMLMPRDKGRRNKLESAHHQLVVFAGVLSRPGKFAGLILQGAVAARTVHRLCESQKWDTEFMSGVKGAPWNFKANAGDGSILERTFCSPTRSAS